MEFFILCICKYRHSFFNIQSFPEILYCVCIANVFTKKRHPNGCRQSVKENEMKYSLGPKADCNQANLTDERSWLSLLIPSSIFFTVLGDGCL